MEPLRRVVTGLDAEERSCFIFDDQAQMKIWSAGESPADNTGREDAGGKTFAFPTAGSSFTVHDWAPGAKSVMHVTDTLDYAVVVSGEVTFITETGEKLLRAGDVLINRGNMHAWRNDGPAVCRIVVAVVPSTPVAGGATMTGEVHL